MPLYEVLDKSFVNNHVREKGDIVEYTGKAGANLKLIGPTPKAPVVDTLEDLA